MTTCRTWNFKLKERSAESKQENTICLDRETAAQILIGKIELIALLNLSSWCPVMVEWLFLTMPWGRLPFVIVVFPDHTHYFQTFKEKLSNRPILAYADYSLPFSLHTDASSVGLGAVPYQKQDGQDPVVSFASRSLKPSEKNYPA